MAPLKLAAPLLEDLRVISFTVRPCTDVDASGSRGAHGGVLGALPGSIWTLDHRCWPTILQRFSDKPEYIEWQRFENHWVNLEQVLRAASRVIEEGGMPAAPPLMVVCGAVPRSCLEDQETYFTYWASCTPDRPSPAWRCMGFDVVDDTFNSVLHSDSEWALRADAVPPGVISELVARLNGVHLAATLEDAMRIADLASDFGEGGSSNPVPCALFEVGLLPARE